MSLPFGLLGRVRDLETKVADAESNITTNETAIEKLTTVKDLTSATEDYALSVNETAKIDISAASTDLHIALTDGVYTIDLEFDGSTFASDQTITLNGNGSTHTNEFSFVVFRGSTALATDEVDVGDGTTDFHRLTNSSTTPLYVNARLVINGTRSRLLSQYLTDTSGTLSIGSCGSSWTAEALTSLSLETGEAATGVCYVKRIA